MGRRKSQKAYQQRFGNLSWNAVLRLRIPLSLSFSLNQSIPHGHNEKQLHVAKMQSYLLRRIYTLNASSENSVAFRLIPIRLPRLPKTKQGNSWTGAELVLVMAVNTLENVRVVFCGRLGGKQIADSVSHSHTLCFHKT